MKQAVASLETYGKSTSKEVGDPLLRPDMQATEVINGNPQRHLLVSKPSPHPGWVRAGFCSHCCSKTWGSQPPAQPAWLECSSPFHQNQPHLGSISLGQTHVKCSAVMCMPHQIPLCSKLPMEVCCAFFQRHCVSSRA